MSPNSQAGANTQLAASEAAGVERESAHSRVLDMLRTALEPNDILQALQAVGLDSKDLAEGVGADERTVRRWLDGSAPNRSNEKAIGQLRVLTIHILQRRGMPVESIARWLRLPDAQLGFVTPLAAIAEDRLGDVVVAVDLYMAPREITSWQPLRDDDRSGEPTEPVVDRGGSDDNESTGEFAAVDRA